jgi:CheY-like chemotaxis protein
MNSEEIYQLIRNILLSDKAFALASSRLPSRLERSVLLSEIGLDVVTLPDLVQELERRLEGKDLGLDDLLGPEEMNTATLGILVSRIETSFKPDSKNPLVVYVDDEEENLFIFKRKFGRRLNLMTFADSRQAADFILVNRDVSLVITDEVMPNLSGNALCDLVHKSKPSLKFILITGNPNNDGDLMYNSLRKNRFYEFINKPMDLEGKGEDYFRMIASLIGM